MIAVEKMEDLQTLIHSSDIMNERYEFQQNQAHIFKNTALNEEKILLAAAKYDPIIHCLEIAAYHSEFAIEEVTPYLDVKKINVQSAEDKTIYCLFLK